MKPKQLILNVIVKVVLNIPENATREEIDAIREDFAAECDYKFDYSSDKSSTHIKSTEIMEVWER